jgi:beta-glucosidase-like glycosyl hydrolase
VIKHIPGHGRAKSDSHLELPRVETDLDELLKTDFMPFQSHNHEDISRATWGMTAHIVYPVLDTEHPVSVSRKGIDFIRNTIGFKGVLLSDDLDMKALDHYGSASDKALAALNAGCDIALYCAGETKIMEKMAENLPKISQNALKVLQNAVKDRTVLA